MEEEKKKRKQNKKKNKQSKGTSVSGGVRESAPMEGIHINGTDQSHRIQNSEAADVQKDVQKAEVDSDRHCANGSEASSLAEAEKTYWLDKVGTLEEKIKQLQKENDAHLQKEADLEMKAFQLQSEKDSWLHKEAGYEEKINQLLDEAATLSLKGVSLEEKIKQLERERDSLVELENSTKETLASVNDNNRGLQAQVMELEESRNNLLQENQLLLESISGLHVQIQNLERSTVSAHLSTENTMHASGNSEMHLQLEAARGLVQKLLSENAELVEKVNELYLELDRRGVASKFSSSVGSDPTIGTAKHSNHVESSNIGLESTTGTAEKPQSAQVAEPMSEVSKMALVSGDMMEPLEDIVIQSERDGGNYVNADDTAVVTNSPETIKSDEIVQIPLDENEVRDVELENVGNDKDDADVPITDAPLIGAPFRLISFVARYVSGADLVNKNSVDSGR